VCLQHCYPIFFGRDPSQDFEPVYFLPLGWLLLLQYPVSNIRYNITNGLCTPVLNNSAPTYIVIGDGGNIEGIAGV
jgi:hypothetical protein